VFSPSGSVTLGYEKYLFVASLDRMKSQLVPVGDLPASDRAEMFRLLQRHFSGVRIDIFQADLRDKNWALLLRDKEGDLKGFSTISFYTIMESELKLATSCGIPAHPGVESVEECVFPISIVYSGDTIMDPSAWSSMALAKSWIDAINTLKTLYASGSLYWFLISSGYRTYRFLPVFWKEFYPRYDMPTAPHMQQFMDALAQEKFGDRYDAQAGVVRLDHPQTLRDLAKIPQERLSDPHVNFFAQKNPTHHQGDELVCLTKICEENLTRAGRRMWFAHQPCDLKQA